jgi:hypothetical protein
VNPTSAPRALRWHFENVVCCGWIVASHAIEHSRKRQFCIDWTAVFAGDDELLRQSHPGAINQYDVLRFDRQIEEFEHSDKS